MQNKKFGSKKQKKKIFTERQKSALGKDALPRVALGKVDLFAKRC